jgi:hypothetical protein
VVLTDFETGEPLADVTVALLELRTGGYTDETGRLVLPGLEPGTYRLLLSQIGYQTDTLRQIQVVAGRRGVVRHRLVSTAVQLKGVEIQEVRTVVSSEVGTLADMRLSGQMLNTVSREAIVRTGDLTALEILRRVPGVSLINYRQLVIRGLNERYNNIMFNYTAAPSLEVEKRIFAFDLVPSSLIERLIVYKTATADLPGDFSGGLTRLETNMTPIPNRLNVGLQLGVRTGTTFQTLSGDAYPGSFAQTLGVFDAARNLPSAFPASINRLSRGEKNTLAGLLPNAWEPTQFQASPDYQFNAEFSRMWEFASGVRFGSITHLNAGR